MASITKRGNRYLARVRRTGYPDLAKTFPTAVEARAWARNEEARIALGLSTSTPPRHEPLLLPDDPPAPTLHEALERYRLTVTPGKKSADQEQSLIRRLKALPMAQRSLGVIRPSDVAAYRDQCLKEGQAPATAMRALALLSHVYTVAAKDWGFHVENPVATIRRPRLPPGRDRRLLPGEEARLLAVLQPALRPVVSLLIETGMRRGELLGLRWADIDLPRRVAVLHHTKNGERRTVPLSTRAVAEFEALPRTSGGRVFGRLRADSVTHWFAKACTAAGISGLRLHDLRREAASRFFEMGLQLPEVAAITGHKTWSMLRRYTVLRAEQLALKLP